MMPKIHRNFTAPCAARAASGEPSSPPAAASAADANSGANAGTVPHIPDNFVGKDRPHIPDNFVGKDPPSSGQVGRGRITVQPPGSVDGHSPAPLR